ncbi:MAG: hypothetical protein CSA89_00230 [Bacteroidales bacterium]|nr:MAG: hypothetical protein CSA89_00230 [Bacteroidales bacterium]
MNTKTILIGISSFLLVLCTMPLGHGMMILMEHIIDKQYLFYASFVIGAVGLFLTIVGVFVNGDTKQTIFGLFGGLLFWTGWIEFAYVYYAHRFDIKPLIDATTGEIITKPEYLIMPSSIGFWVIFIVLYTFSIKTGCNFFNYIQKKLFKNSNTKIEIKPIARHTSLVTFMELNLLLWTSYLLLLFCYDDNFLGDTHPITTAVAAICLVGSIYMFIKQLKYKKWGYAIRYSIATVIVFWTFVEVLGRRNIFQEIWVHPLEYQNEMIAILIAFIGLWGVLIYNSKHKKQQTTNDN